MLEIIFLIIINVIVTVAIVLVALKVEINVMSKIMEQTENRIDQKQLNIESSQQLKGVPFYR
ncbi:hypothetical protein [Lactiplantibacillus plantarum]|uniref:hypothetical protein n=1 Tax=Lactiplantibacillus plantarum TaxID=1590 RepID=UPI001C6A8358|nr:hypothetical protein [Lactiplantibacillus plantarum]QYN61864.1 hypothetical protein G7B65_02500 [Lactiplantibacillus plantarum]